MEALSTLEINKVLGENAVTKRYFIGTYPSCLTPRTRKKKYAFITNTDDHNLPGRHWCAWFVDGQRISFYDSYGRSWDDPTLPEHYKDIAKLFKQISYTNTRVQSWASNACGYFCIHFIYVKALGLDYEHFLNEYSTNFERNEDIVYEFYNSIQ